MSMIPEIDELVQKVLDVRAETMNKIYDEGLSMDDVSSNEFLQMVVETMAEKLEMEGEMAERGPIVMKDIKVDSIKHETPKAWLVILEDKKEVWFPKSQCKYEDGIMSVPEWLCKEKDLIEWDD